ncbi:50S ribosomal protein L3 [Proteinivorax hydrogeniformans]|uniref:Large ribosomal subunit protein uL3 n=1 Tax=Proteinivorax hydrogeniformans TaxID=1826727 RepID=A0AAU8HU12_9FIRM
MKKAIIGKKLGMSQIFAEDGEVLPVTVIEAGPCTVVQKRNEEVDGYSAVQLGYGEVKEVRANKAMKGHFNKAGVKPMRHLAEFKLEDGESLEVGQEIKADFFEEGEAVDVTGTSKGKGFSGSIKRHNYSRGPMTHGSHYHRGPGSLGAVDPARVFKGTKLPGRMGGETVTVRNLDVVKVDAERNLLLVKGAVPGKNGSIVFLRDTNKTK